MTNTTKNLLEDVIKAREVAYSILKTRLELAVQDREMWERRLREAQAAEKQAAIKCQEEFDAVQDLKKDYRELL